ncbi:MAG: hypothetical protein J6T28_04990 [Paludibacteraceae bacterium]|nr:hypothetical protein [Paludibacteraceae bacterium]MBR3518591.1 hypothetical protein [Paludibacteraceae bacterium]MBR4813842.1 hypothetical protein [Paludibacteraceae bacterium]MCR5497650.1 hypothetical protein [Paludibacteraceae bacterium]
MKKTKLITIALLIVYSFISSSCGNASKESSADRKDISVGFSPGPYSDLFKAAIQPALEKKGYNVKVVEFTDWVTPNLALANNEIDANIYQNTLYRQNFCDTKGVDLTATFSVPTAALGLYSDKYKAQNVDELKAQLQPGGIVSVPNDAVNLARALRFLRSIGLLTIKSTVDDKTATENDIDENPFGLKIVPLEAAQLPRSLDGSTLAVIPGNYAISSGLKLSSSIVGEALPSELLIWFVVNTKDANAQFVKDVQEAYESEDFKNYFEDPAHEYDRFQRPQWYVDKWNIQNR